MASFLHPRFPTLLAALLLVALALQVTPILSADPASGNVTHVHIQNTAYNPETVTILTGETVEWDNHDAVQHTVTSNTGHFSSGQMSQGQFFEFQFNTPGVYEYHCVNHAGQTGTVVVADSTDLPDLVVTEVTDQDLVPGLEKTIEVTVRNIGGSTAGASITRVFYEYDDELHEIGDIETPLLGPMQTATGTVSWTTLGMLGDFRVVALADAEDEVPEANKENNTGEATLAVLVSGIPGVSVLDELGL